MAFEEYLKAGFGLWFIDIDPDDDDSVDLEIETDNTSPIRGLIKPSVGTFLGYTVGGIEIDFGPQYKEFFTGFNETADSAYLEKCSPSIKTRGVFNADPTVRSVTRPPGQDIQYKFWISSSGSAREYAVCIVEYNRIGNKDVVTIWVFRKGYFVATNYKIFPTHEPADIEFKILRMDKIDDPGCPRETNDLGCAWYVDRYDPTVIVYQDGTPITSVTAREVVPLMPNNVMVL